jgi:hypothetical protein
MCEERQRLSRACEELDLALGISLTSLNNRAAELSPLDYEHFRRFVQLARLETQRARLALEAHISAH